MLYCVKKLGKLYGSKMNFIKVTNIMEKKTKLETTRYNNYINT